MNDVQIDVSNLDSSTPIVIAAQDIVLKSVKKFAFAFNPEVIVADSPEKREFIFAILSKFHLPNATNISLEGRGTHSRSDLLSCKPAELLLHQFLSKFSVRVPKAVDFNIAIRGKPFRHHTTLPIHFPAGLEHLTFKCNTNLSFPKKDSQEVAFDLKKLRTVSLGVNPQNETFAVKQWLDWLVNNLRLCGGWQEFEKLVVFKCEEKWDGIAYRYEETVMRDDVIVWCNQYKVLPQRNYLSCPQTFS